MGIFLRKEKEMDFKDLIADKNDKLRIIQELVPGKQITLAHIIASPDPIMYQKLGLNPDTDFSGSAIGILTVSPAETAIIAADIATKSGNIDLSFVDRFSGTLIITGLISDVESALKAICDYAKDRLNFTVCEISRT